MIILYFLKGDNKGINLYLVLKNGTCFDIQMDECSNFFLSNHFDGPINELNSYFFAAACAAFFALTFSTSSLYLLMQSFLPLLGIPSAIRSHRSFTEAG